MSARASFVGCGLAMLIVASIGSSVARAEDSESLIREGVRLRRAQKDQEALSYFQKAYDGSKTPRAAAQLGLCEQALGMWVASEAHVREALAAQKDAWVTKNRATLESSVETVSRRLASLEIMGGPKGAEVLVDGERVGLLPMAQPRRVPAGVLRVDVTAPGFQTQTRTVTVRAGEVLRVPVQLVAEARRNEGPLSVTPQTSGSPPTSSATGPIEPAVAPSPESMGARGWMRPLAWVTAGAAVVALGVAGTEHYVAYQRSKWFNAIYDAQDNPVTMECDQSYPNAGDPRCQSLLDERRHAMRIAIPAYVTGAVLAGASAALFYFSSRPRAAEGGQSLACSLVPSPRPELSCRLTF